ncbi:MAG: GspE/PulE family protein [Armatimonadota bacterium]
MHPKIGLTFASGLRSILRQDPDIVLVGEIRDEETLRMAVQASLTGHLVFSTLHCNDTSSAAARLMDMGLEPYLLTSSVLGFLSQRLVRRVCPHCKEPFDPPEDLMRRLGVEDARGIFYKGPGCEKCRHTGYYGRIGVFEVLPVTEAVRQAILREAPASDIRRIAVSEGMQTMRDDGLAKAKAGITALEEVLRAVYIEDE